jgi:hypothetical protein
LALPVHFPVVSLAFSPDGKRLLTSAGNGTATIWEAETGRRVQELKGHTRTILAVAFSPDGKWIVTGGKDETARIWDAGTGQPVSVLMSGGWVTSVAFSSNGKRLITAGIDVFTGTDNTAKVWDTETGRLLRTLEGQKVPVLSAGFSPNGKWFVTGNDDGAVQLWDSESGRRLAPIGGHLGGIKSIAFSPDSRLLVTAGGGLGVGNTNRTDSLAKVWDLENGRELLTLEHSNQVFCAAFSLDGRRVATGDGAGTVKVWESFPWRTNEYPDSAVVPMERRLSAFKREHWSKRQLAATRLSAATRSVVANSSAEAAPLIPPRDSGAWPELIDLSRYYNAGLNERWIPGRNVNQMDNNLSALPQGLQWFAGVLFDVRGIIQLTRNVTNWEAFPVQVAGIPIQTKCRRLHFLHATAYGPTVANGTLIANFIIHYANGDREQIPVVFGKDVFDWFSPVGPGQRLDRAVEAWSGTSFGGQSVRLYKSTWDNPRLDVEVSSMDYVSQKTTAAPFLVALTAQPEREPEIVGQPQALKLAPGERATFEVKVRSDGPLIYQWLHQGTNIVGATNAVLTVERASPKNIGGYAVEVRAAVAHPVRSVTSQTAGLGLTDGLVTFGALKREVFLQIPGTILSALTNHARFPGHPDEVGEISEFEAPANVADAYGQKISGYLIPPVTGEYVFYLNSDDQGALFLSTDGTPGNKRLIATEPVWSNSRYWLATARRSKQENISAPIRLTAGQRYYVEALMKEGAGSDNLAVTWRLPGGPAPVNLAPPIPGTYLAYPNSPEKRLSTTGPQ